MTITELRQFIQEQAIKMYFAHLTEAKKAEEKKTEFKKKKLSLSK